MSVSYFIQSNGERKSRGREKERNLYTVKFLSDENSIVKNKRIKELKTYICC